MPTPDVRQDRDDARPAPDVAIDWVHLQRQTEGLTSLARELLALFNESADALLHCLAAARTAAERRDLAHRLKGSALAVGAFRVARAAAAVETVDAQDWTGASLDELRAGIADVRRMTPHGPA